MTRTRNPVIWVMSIIGALQLLVASAAFGEVVPAKWAALAGAVVAAGQFGVQFWVKARVTPLSDPRDRDGMGLVRAR